MLVGATRPCASVPAASWAEVMETLADVPGATSWYVQTVLDKRLGPRFPHRRYYEFWQLSFGGDR